MDLPICSVFFSLPPQQVAVVIFKCRKYFVNCSWVNTRQNYFKALQFFHAHCAPTESSHLGNQIILKNLMSKITLNALSLLTSCSNDSYSCVQKMLSLNTCTNTHQPKNQRGSCWRVWSFLLGIYSCWGRKQESGIRNKQRSVAGGTKCRSYNLKSAKPSGPKLIQEKALKVALVKPHIIFGWNSSTDYGLQGCEEQPGIKASFHALAAEGRYLTRWNTHPAPSLIPFSQINCVRLNPTRSSPAKQSLLARDSLALAKPQLSQGRAQKCLQGGCSSHPWAESWEAAPGLD